MRRSHRLQYLGCLQTRLRNRHHQRIRRHHRLNREVDGETVKQITDNQFMEVLMAPKFTAEALEIAAAKKNVRVLEVPLEAGANRSNSNASVADCWYKPPTSTASTAPI